MQQPEHYLDDPTYTRLLDDLARLTRGLIDRDAFVEVLGDAGVWPRLCLLDSLAAAGKPASGVSLSRPNFKALR